MEEDKKIEVYTGDSLSNTIPTSNIQEDTVLKGEDALRSQVQADQETQAAVERNKTEENKGLTGTLSDFGSYVGKSLKNFATEFPNKIEETYNDPKRRFALMLSLKTIDEASRYKPLTEARSPLGQIAKNVTDVISEDVAQRQKTRKLDIEDIKATAALMKAKQGPNRMYASPAEKAMEKDIENFQKTEDIRLGSKNVLEQRFNLMQAAATKGQTLPTGLVEDALLPVKEVLLYLKPEDKNRYEKLLTDYTGKDINRMSLQDQVTFQQELNSLTTQAAIGYAKNLYPVSEKDLEQLFKGFGSGRLTGEALTRLIASQKATDEFADLNAKTYFDLIKKDPGNLQAKLDARKIVESQLKEQNEKLVNPEILKKLYNIDDPKQATNFQLSTAKYYNQIAPTVPRDKDINLYSSIKESREKDVIQQKQIGDQILKEFNQSRKTVK
jgi:hypothetical protein